MKQSRRNFLRDSACGLTAAAMMSSLDRFGLVNAMVQQQPDVASDYKALVCIFLSGGTDCNNMVVPLDSEFSAYAAVRGESGNPGTGPGLGLPQATLIPINPPIGRQFGFAFRSGGPTDDVHLKNGRSDRMGRTCFGPDRRA